MQNLTDTIVYSRIFSKWIETCDELWLTSIIQLARLFYRDADFQKKFFVHGHYQGLRDVRISGGSRSCLAMSRIASGFVQI